MQLVKFLGTATLIVAVTLASSLDASAQKSKFDLKRNEEATVIEVKDGKVYLNDKEIAVLENADQPIFFMKNGENSHAMSWFMDNDNDAAGSYAKALTLYSGSKEGSQFVFESSPHLFEYKMDGNGNSFFHDMDAKFDFESDMDFEGMKHFNSRLAPIDGYTFLYSDGMFSNAESMRDNRRAKELAERIRRSDGDTSEIEAELDELLAEMFSVKQEAQQARVDKLREQLAELEQRVSERNADHEGIISKRRNELLGKRSKYDW